MTKINLNITSYSQNKEKNYNFLVRILYNLLISNNNIFYINFKIDIYDRIPEAFLKSRN